MPVIYKATISPIKIKKNAERPIMARFVLIACFLYSAGCSCLNFSRASFLACFLAFSSLRYFLYSSKSLPMALIRLRIAQIAMMPTMIQANTPSVPKKKLRTFSSPNSITSMIKNAATATISPLYHKGFVCGII